MLVPLKTRRHRAGLLALAALLALLCRPHAVRAQEAVTPNAGLAPIPIAGELWSSVSARLAAQPGLSSLPAPVVPPGSWLLQEADQGSAWTKGLLVGGLIGVATGVLAHALVDGLPCDTCSDGGSAAEGARLEFALLFGVAGAGIGALIAR